MSDIHNTQLNGQSVKYVATVGLAVLDHVYQVGEMPEKPEKHFASSLQEVVGGIAANAALAVVGLGGHSMLFTRVGNDSAGKTIIANLKKSGVGMDCLEIIDGQQTASSAVVLDRHGERMVVNYKPNDLFSSSPQFCNMDSKSIGAVLGDLRWPAGTKTVFAWARTLDIPTILDFDLAPDDVSDAILDNTSHIIFAQNALTQYAQKPNLKAALAVVKAMHPHIQLAVTAGADGVLYMNEEGRIKHIKSRPVPVVSTLGAGDVFHGAASLALMEGMNFEDALRFANDVAATMVSRPRDKHTLPTRSEVEDLQRSFK